MIYNINLLGYFKNTIKCLSSSTPLPHLQKSTLSRRVYSPLGRSPDPICCNMMCEISRHGNVRTSVFGIKILSVSRVSLPHPMLESFQEEKCSRV